MLFIKIKRKELHTIPQKETHAAGRKHPNHLPKSRRSNSDVKTGRSPDLGHLFQAFPGLTSGFSEKIGAADIPIQWRVRAGLEPASLFSAKCMLCCAPVSVQYDVL